ncbi:DUF6768 family protein [Kordiimonas aestuarii]|uniref:DUF6768 family protein n=1 Tax=Kordiimonas aestuarii TaxID=1005925 RepID=UPI0021D2A2E4|nr:DUF6768 family protein [Kordiimonas aestuarii]
MNNLDERIREELERETDEIDELLASEDGLPDMVAAAFTGGLRRWMWLTGFITLVVTGFMVWCGYRFYVAAGLDDRVFWGIWFIVTLNAQVALKQWQWLEMNRSSMMREIKRLELVVAKLVRARHDG